MVITLQDGTSVVVRPGEALCGLPGESATIRYVDLLHMQRMRPDLLHEWLTTTLLLRLGSPEQVREAHSVEGTTDEH